MMCMSRLLAASLLFVSLSSTGCTLLTGHKQQGTMLMRTSYYSSALSGRRTANGERYNPHELTAAHRTLPFGTRLRLVYPRTGRAIVVRVNDRGPAIRGRDLDVSLLAARRLGMVRGGVVNLYADILE